MLYKSSLVSLLGALSLTVAKSSSEDPSPEQIAKDRATVKPESPVSNVPGLSFNRFVNIWLENTVCCSERYYYNLILILITFVLNTGL